MGICKQIHDRKPTQFFQMDMILLHGKHPLSATQMDAIKGADSILRFGVQDIAQEWRIVDMMCECVDLMQEMDEMKRHGHVSKAA